MQIQNFVDIISNTPFPPVNLNILQCSLLEWDFSFVIMCDVIKQNQSEVGQIQFSLFLTNCMHHLYRYILQKTPLILVNWFQRYEQLKDAKNNMKQKTFSVLFGSILKSTDFWLILLDHITYISVQQDFGKVSCGK